MEVVLVSSCEEAEFTDGISIAAGLGCTHTDVLTKDTSSVSMLDMKNLHPQHTLLFLFLHI